MFLIKPVELLMVAIVGSALDQVPPVTVDVNVFVPAKQIVCAPLNTPTLGAPLIVIALEAVALLQPPLPNTVYVMVALPTRTPESKPEIAFIDTLFVSEEVQFPPGEVETNCVVVPSHKVVVPLIIPAFGFAVTVSVRVETASGQNLPKTVYEIVTVPGLIPEISPVALIFAIVLSEDVQVPPGSVELKGVVVV